MGTHIGVGRTSIDNDIELSSEDSHLFWITKAGSKVLSSHTQTLFLLDLNARKGFTCPPKLRENLMAVVPNPPIEATATLAPHSM